MSVTIAAESRVRVLGESRVQISDGERVRVYAGDTVYINESTGGGDLERAVRTVTVAATADPADGVIVLAGSGGFALTLPTTGFDDGQAVEVWGAASTDCTVESAADLFPIEGGATVADIPVAANQVLRFKFYTTVDDEPAWRCIYDSTAAGGESNPVDVIVAFMDDYALALVPALGYFGLSAGARVLIATGDDRGLWTWNGTELVDLVDLWDGTHAGTELWLESVHRGPATGSVVRFGERWTMGLNLQGQPTLRYDGQIDRRVDEHTGHPDAHRLVVGETVTILDHAARNAVWESGLGPDATMGVFEWDGNVYTASDPSTDTDVMICEVTAAEYVQDSGVAVVAHDIAGTPTLVPITGVPEGQSAPLGDVYHDVANGQVIGFTHSGDGAGRSCVGIVRTDDPLVEWSWCGLAVTPNITAGWTQNTIGSFVPYVVVDFDGTDYFVLYHKDQLAGGTVILLAASRAPVADVCTAALTSTVSTWEKWTGTDWSEPGIEGAPADIAPDGWIHTHANAFYDATSNEVVLIGTSNGDTLRAVRSSDAVTFGTPVQIENRHNGFVDPYATFYSGEPSRPKELRAGDSPVLWTVRMIGGQSQWSDPTIIIEQKLVGWGHLGGAPGGSVTMQDVVDLVDALDNELAPVAKTGAYSDLTGRPGLGSAASASTSDFDAAGAATAAVSAHVGDDDPHGDRAYAVGLFAANDALVFKGSLNCSANPNYPAGDAGHVYRVSVAGKIGGASGTNVEVGDTLTCVVDGSAAGTEASVGANWSIVQANIDGAVIGPASSTAGNIPAFGGTTGKTLADSGIPSTMLGGMTIPHGTAAGDFIDLTAQVGFGNNNQALHSSTANTDGAAVYVPFTVDASWRQIDALQVDVRTAPSAGNVRLGIHSDSGGRPGAVVVDAGTATAVGTGLKTITFTATTLAPGRYWAVCVFQGLTGTNPTVSTPFYARACAPDTAPVSGTNSLPYWRTATGAVSGALAANPTVAIVRAANPIVPTIRARLA